MAIDSVLETLHLISVFDESGHLLFSRPRGNGPNDGLIGYTATTVSVRSGFVVVTYDGAGRQLTRRTSP